MNLHNDMSESEIIFVEKEFASDDETYNLYNVYTRNTGFRVRKKGIDKSRKLSHEIIF